MKQVKEIRMEFFNYQYPHWISEVTQVKAVQVSKSIEIWISLLKGYRNDLYFDIRIWVNGSATNKGVILDRRTAGRTREMLDEYLSGELEASLEELEEP